MKKQIDLSKLFIESLCSFECSKKAKQAGMTCANTFYAYNNKGELGDGAWLETVTGAEMYPAINLAFAIGMLDDTNLKFDKVKCEENDVLSNKYSISYEDEVYKSNNLIDIIIELWIKHKK